MIQRSPAEVAVKAMSLEGHATASVRERIEHLRLDLVDDAYVDSVRASCVPPLGFNPRDKCHESSQRFLIEQRVRTWFDDADVDMIIARGLIEHGRAREVAETLILSDAPVNWICSMVERSGLGLTPRSCSLYRHFFFRVDLLDEHSLCDFLVRRGVGNSRVLRLAARLRGNSLALLMSMIRLGRLPSGMNVELARVLSATRTAASIGALDAVLSDDPRAAEKYASVAKTMCEVIEAVGDPEGDLDRNIQRLMLDTSGEDIPHIDQLAGEHSVQLEPSSLAAVDDELAR